MSVVVESETVALAAVGFGAVVALAAALAEVAFVAPVGHLVPVTSTPFM